MKSRPIHRYMRLVQCPVCHSTYMEEGEAACWECLSSGPDATSEMLPEEHERLAAALDRLRAARIEAEEDAGALGSMAGMGFAPAEREIPALRPRVERPPRVHDDEADFTPTYAADQGWPGPFPDPERRAAGRAERFFGLWRALGPSRFLLAAAGAVAVVSLLLVALAAFVLLLSLGATGYLAWRLLRTPRR